MTLLITLSHTVCLSLLSNPPAPVGFFPFIQHDLTTWPHPLISSTTITSCSHRCSSSPTEPLYETLNGLATVTPSCFFFFFFFYCAGETRMHCVVIVVHGSKMKGFLFVILFVHLRPPTLCSLLPLLEFSAQDCFLH